MPQERDFRVKLIKDIYNIFPECVILRNDPNFLQGVPDLTVLYKNRWGMLETKKEKMSSRRPNQEYYIDLFDTMSFARFVSYENKEQVLYELQQALRVERFTRILKRV